MAVPAEGTRLVRVSARPLSKFSAAGDFSLWIQRFEIYLAEAEIPAEKRAKELLSCLDDEPFRIVNQLGLVNSVDYGLLKKELQKHYAPEGNELEWQYRLQSRRQKLGEPLSEFAGELRVMVDKAYPAWVHKQRLQIARNQFIQGVESASIQLVLIRENPETLEAVVELAQQQLSVETAQKRVHRRPLASSGLVEQNEETLANDSAGANALRRSQETSSSARLEELSRQVQRLTVEVTRLQASPEPRERRPRSGGGPRGGPTCWNCGMKGHFRRDCTSRKIEGGRQNAYRRLPLSSMATEAAVMVKGFIEQRATKMLVDTGSAVTIIREDTWREATHPRQKLRPPTCPVVAANGEQLELCGRGEVTLKLGNILTRCPVLIAKNVTQECLLGADFLEQSGCIIDLRGRTLMMGGSYLPLHFQAGRKVSTCHVSCAETVSIPGLHQMELPVQVRTTDGTASEFTGMLEPESNFVERRGVLVARSIHSISTYAENSLVRILNPSPAPITVYRNERVGTLQPLEGVLESVSVNQTWPQSRHCEDEDTTKAIKQLLSKTQGLSQTEGTALESLLRKYSDVISLHSGDLGRTGIVHHKIDTGEAHPVKQPARRLPFHQREAVKQMLDDMLKQGVIEPACGPWSSPIVIVKKKDGTPRFCVDYRRLNSFTKKDAHPLPRVDDTLDALTGAKWFSTIDLASGYWQVEMEPVREDSIRNPIWPPSISCHALRTLQCPWNIPTIDGIGACWSTLEHLPGVPR